jgi:hypothetical protein
MISYFLMLILLISFFYGISIYVNSSKFFGVMTLLVSTSCYFFVLRPNYFIKFSKFIGVDRGLDLVVYFLFIVLIFLILRIHVKFQEHKYMITKLSRHIALMDNSIKK